MGDFQTDMNKGLQVFRGMEWWLKALWIVGVIAVLTILGLFVMPSVILAFENLWIAGLWFGVTALAAYLIFNQNLRTGFVYAVDNICLKMRNLVADADPFSTALNAINRLKKRRQELGKGVEILRGKKEEIVGRINKLRAQLAEAKTAFDYATKIKNESQQIVQSSKGQRLREAITQVSPMQDRLIRTYELLNKTYQVLGTKIEKEEADLTIALETHDIMLTSAGAVRSAQKMLSGPDKEMFDLAMKGITDRTSALVGEVEQFLDFTKPLLEASDFESQAKAMAALEEFQSWSSVDGELISSEEKQQFLLTAGSTQFIPASQSPTTNTQEDEYQLITRK